MAWFPEQAYPFQHKELLRRFFFSEFCCSFVANGGNNLNQSLTFSWRNFDICFVKGPSEAQVSPHFELLTVIFTAAGAPSRSDIWMLAGDPKIMSEHVQGSISQYQRKNYNRVTDPVWIIYTIPFLQHSHEPVLLTKSLINPIRHLQTHESAQFGHTYWKIMIMFWFILIHVDLIRTMLDDVFTWFSRHRVLACDVKISHNMYHLRYFVDIFSHISFLFPYLVLTLGIITLPHVFYFTFTFYISYKRFLANVGWYKLYWSLIISEACVVHSPRQTTTVSSLRPDIVNPWRN